MNFGPPPGPTQDLTQTDRKPDAIWYQWFRSLSLWVSNIEKLQSFTPAVSATTGTITTAAATGSYSTIGPTVHFDIAITITTNGTGAGALVVALPSMPLTNFAGAAGRESTVPFAVTGYGAAGVQELRIVKTSDGSYPGADGYQISIQGSYRKA